MRTFEEQHLRFTFDDQWTVVKYDDHADYRDRIGRLERTRAVDFVGFCAQEDEALYWIEVKDFRGYRIQNKRRMSDGELATEVAEKVRDSVAGVLGAYRTAGEWRPWQPFVRGLWRRGCPIRVILWLEEDPMPGPQARRRNAAQVRARLLKDRLRWLTTKVLVISQATDGCPDGLTVADLPGAGQAG